MKVAVNVKDRNEAVALRAAWDHLPTRAATLMIGHLLSLPSMRSRERVLRYVTEELREQAEAEAGNSGSSTTSADTKAIAGM